MSVFTAIGDSRNLWLPWTAPDPTMEMAHVLQVLEKKGYPVDDEFFYIRDTDCGLWHMHLAVMSSYNADRCRMYRATRPKSRNPPGRQAYLEAKSCAGCGQEFQPRTAGRAYCSKSCFDRKQQKKITIDGETKAVKEWSKASGTSVATIKARLKRRWSARQAVFGKGGM